MKKINDRSIKFSGKTYTENNFELGDEVSVKGIGLVVKIENLDNQDGTQNIVCVVKFTELETLKR